MRYWIANTDIEWFRYLAARAPLDNVNFWQPGVHKPVNLDPGAPWIFKLHEREGGSIVGGGFFVHYTTMTVRLAWDTFGTMNGAPTYEAFARALGVYRVDGTPREDAEAGSSVLVQPFFLPREMWLERPTDWSRNLTTGKRYDTLIGEGQRVWDELQISLTQMQPPETRRFSEQWGGYGAPTLVAQRLGQEAFRILVMDAYKRRCAVTGERTLPVLEAAHIVPFSLVGKHDLSNGLLLRSDLHTLLDQGYLTVTPDFEVRVSSRIRKQFENGRDYYALDKRTIALPEPPFPRPSREMLEWHGDVVFKG